MTTFYRIDESIIEKWKKKNEQQHNFDKGTNTNITAKKTH